MEIIIPLEFDDTLKLQVSEQDRLEIHLLNANDHIISWLNKRQLEKLIEGLNDIKKLITHD